MPHGWLPVSRYDEIAADFYQTYQEGETALRTAILINCGAAEDVRQLLELDKRENVRVVIIDSHRCVAGLEGRDELGGRRESDGRPTARAPAAAARPPLQTASLPSRRTSPRAGRCAT